MGWLDKAKAVIGQAAEAVNEVTGSPLSSSATDAHLPAAAALVPTEAAAAFPDDADAVWQVVRSWVSHHGLALVEAVPSTDVGYSSFTFAFSASGDHVTYAGIYIPADDDGWSLLSSRQAGLPTTLAPADQS